MARTHPPVLVFRWRERLGLAECPYVVRWRLEVRGVGSVRVHHWLASDDPRAFHDHPWWFVTLVLRGGYTNYTPGVPPPHLHDNDGTVEGCPGCFWEPADSPVGEYLRAGSVRYRPAVHRHFVVPDKSGAWTLLVTGPKTRNWGFWPGGRFRKANKWFASRGHHPCA